MTEAVGTGELLAATVPLTPPPPEPPEPVPRGPEEDVVTVAPDPLAVTLALAALPTPAGIPGEPLSTPLAVAGREERVVAAPDAAEVPETVPVPEPDTVPEAEAVPEADADADEEGEESEALQERSYRGVVDKVLPTIPKLGEGVSGAASWRVYQKTLVFPKRGQPTSSQYVLAFSMEATARFWFGPLTGQPVSVTQTSFPPTAACVWL